jgi:ABC-type multidrug transport system ATPase subunit
MNGTRRRPRIVFLDEPSTGLDVAARRSLRDGVRAFRAKGGTVVLTSHYLEEVAALARRVVVIGGGRVLADDSVPAVRNMVAIRRVSRTAVLAGVAVWAYRRDEGRRFSQKLVTHDRSDGSRCHYAVMTEPPLSRPPGPRPRGRCRLRPAAARCRRS